MEVRLLMGRFLTLLTITCLPILAFSQTPKAQGEPKLLVAPFTQAEAKKARSEWATFLKVPETRSLDLGKGVKLDLILIPPGVFKMGSPKGEAEDDETQHEVEITKAFYMAVHETTQEQYTVVMGANPSAFQNGGLHAEKLVGKDTSKFPAECVSWDAASRFCQKSEVKGMRLPTEAQWEYACRAGTQTKYHFGDEITDKKANFNGGSKLGRTEKVGSYPENGFGLFDMHGNVWEWCLDGYRKDYEKLHSKDPIENQSDVRVLRVVLGTTTLSVLVPLSASTTRRIPASTAAVSAWLSRREECATRESRRHLSLSLRSHLRTSGSKKVSILMKKRMVGSSFL